MMIRILKLFFHKFKSIECNILDSGYCDVNWNDHTKHLSLFYQVKWPVKEYGEIESKNGITILYQMHKPSDFDPSKKYPLLIEVYGGPGFQKVQDR